MTHPDDDIEQAIRNKPGPKAAGCRTDWQALQANKATRHRHAFVLLLARCHVTEADIERWRRLPAVLPAKRTNWLQQYRDRVDVEALL